MPSGLPQPALWKVIRIENRGNLQVYRVTVYLGLGDARHYHYETDIRWEWMGEKFFRVLDVRPKEIYAIGEETRAYKKERVLKKPTWGYLYYGIRLKVTSKFTKSWPAAVPYSSEIMKVI